MHSLNLTVRNYKDTLTDRQTDTHTHTHTHTQGREVSTAQKVRLTINILLVPRGSSTRQSSGGAQKKTHIGELCDG